jgi:mRNA-degrading endonuclease RelE of RelBE toxin-antitoxin system
LTWQLEWQPPALRDLSRLDPPVQERVITAVERFATTGEGDVIRLRGIEPPEWRLRVGKWRVRFRQNPRGQTLQVLRVLLRDQAY